MKFINKTTAWGKKTNYDEYKEIKINFHKFQINKASNMNEGKCWKLFMLQIKLSRKD